MRRSGFSLVELLVTLFVGTIVLLAAGSFYLYMVQSWTQAQTQADLRRLASRIEQDMARFIVPANGIPPGSCGPAQTPDSLPVQVPAGVIPSPDSGNPDPLAGGGYVCYYRDPADDVLMRCRFPSPASTACEDGTAVSLLTGTLTSHPVRLTDLQRGSEGGLVVQPGAGLRFTRTGGTSVDVGFTLATFDGGEPDVGPMSFATRFRVRN